MSRPDGRAHDQGRPVLISPGFLGSAPSALIEVGRTRVLCTAIVETGVPPWLRGQGRGWLTAEYGMLPASTGQRKPRDAAKGKLDGEAVLDLPYVEDSRADVDMNVVMTGSDGLVEVQGTAEGTPFPRADLNSLLDLAHRGMVGLRAAQEAAIA